MVLRKWENNRARTSGIVLALMFSGICVGGYYLENLKNGLPEILSGRPWVLYAVLVLFALFLFFLFLLRLIFMVLNLAENKRILKRREGTKCLYGRWIENRPFLTAYLTLMILYIPYTVISYPGIFMGDVGKTLMQGFGIWSLFSQQPPFYTLLFSGILKAGYSVFHSWNAAAMTAAVFQKLFLFAVIAEGCRLLILRSIRWEVCIIYIAYYCLSLIVSNYMLLLTKDVWYVAFFFLWIQGLADIIDKRTNSRPFLTVTVGMLGMLCFRNEAILVLLLSLLLCALFDRRHGKKLLAFAAEAAALYGILVLVIYPALGMDRDGIDENSRRDLCSILFQQTARTVQAHRGEITPEEEAAILNAFEFETLEEITNSYDPDYADNIKNCFTAPFGSDEAESYFRVWKEMGKKYPKSYVMAILSNYYQYFYPFTPFWVYSYDYSADNMALVNDMLGFTDFHHPDALASARAWYEGVRETVYGVPPLSLFNGSGVVAWVMMIWTAWLLSRREKEKFALMIPLWIVFLFCLFSPCNGSYGRYQYPIFITLPWIIPVTFIQRKSASL